MLGFPSAMAFAAESLVHLTLAFLCACVCLFFFFFNSLVISSQNSGTQTMQAAAVGHSYSCPG